MKIKLQNGKVMEVTRGIGQALIKMRRAVEHVDPPPPPKSSNRAAEAKSTETLVVDVAAIGDAEAVQVEGEVPMLPDVPQEVEGALSTKPKRHYRRRDMTAEGE